jgi:hypothetical protein
MRSICPQTSTDQVKISVDPAGEASQPRAFHTFCRLLKLRAPPTTCIAQLILYDYVCKLAFHLGNYFKPP